MLHTPPIIAVVDPDIACRDMLRDLLDEEGYQVIACAEPYQARTLPADKQPDVLLLDVGPEMSRAGYDVQGLLRHMLARRQTAVILCSTDPHLATAPTQALRELGCATLIKPFDIDTLLSLVRAELQRANERAQKVGGDDA